MIPDQLLVGTKGARLNLHSLRAFGSRHLAIWSWIPNSADFWGTTTLHRNNPPEKPTLQTPILGLHEGILGLW